MLEKCPAESVHVWPRILYLAYCAQDTWNSFETLSGEVANVVVFDVFVSEVLEMDESRVRISKHGVTIAGNHFSFTQSFAHVLFNYLLAGPLSLVIFLEFDQPLEAFLVREAMQRTGKAIDCCRKCEVGVSEG
jgi:hypothetical protein